VASLLVAACVAAPFPVAAIGEATRVEIRGVAYTGGDAEPRPSARRRLAWEVRKRTSVATRLQPGMASFSDPSIFETPFLYWTGSDAFPPLSSQEVAGLRRFVEFGGFVLIDDAAPERDSFDASVRRDLLRAFPSAPLRRVPADHTLYRSFYLVDRPVGRVAGPGHLEGIMRGDRLAVVYARLDLGGAWARDNLGTWLHTVTPGGESQREAAIRLGVNVVMYALCLDYKDDQVHAPFLMRRRGGAP